MAKVAGIRLWPGRLSLKRKDGEKPSGGSHSSLKTPPCLQHTLQKLISPCSQVISKHSSYSTPYHSSPTQSHSCDPYLYVCNWDPNKDAPQCPIHDSPLKDLRITISSPHATGLFWHTNTCTTVWLPRPTQPLQMSQHTT